MSSLYDVAKLAGVSKTLVSRTINRQSGVSEKSRQKILAAMAELQYKPNQLARSLVLKKTQTIGVVMDTLCEPYFFRLIDGIEREADRIGYDVVFASGRNSTPLKNRAIKYFSQGRTDGILLYGSNLDDERIIEELAQSSFPFVVVENTFSRLNLNNVIVDSAFGSKLAVDHLFRCGCGRIHHVGGDMRHKVSLERRDGYITAMQAHGAAVSSDMILNADFTVESSYRVMREHLSSGRGALPDAFYCGSDNTAYGVMMALEDAGLRVPEDVMLVGFDDDQPPRVNRPLKGLTTLSQPLEEMGVSALDILVKDIERPSEEKQRVVFYPELILRETTRQ
jgi:DNA-binding LacI/PurR family transcriptional regulator